jgi:hypothetical protein
MLYQTETGFIDVVIEPQFAHFQFGSQLASIRSSDLTSLQRMTNSVRGEIDFRQHDSVFPFTGYAYLDDLARQLKTMSVITQADRANENFSRKPAAFMFLGFEEDDYYGESEEWQGALYPDEVFDFQFSAGRYLEYFRVWPLFHVPAELRSTAI